MIRLNKRSKFKTLYWSKGRSVLEKLLSNFTNLGGIIRQRKRPFFDRIFSICKKLSKIFSFSQEISRFHGFFFVFSVLTLHPVTRKKSRWNNTNFATKVNE